MVAEEGRMAGEAEPSGAQALYYPGPDSHNRTTYWVQIEAVSKQPGYTTNLWMQLIIVCTSQRNKHGTKQLSTAANTFKRQ